MERSHRPAKNLFTLVDVPVSLADYQAIMEQDYTEATGRFLKSVVMVKVVDEKAQRLFSDEKPYILESFDRAGRMETFLAPETMPRVLAKLFQIPEDSISAAFSWTENPQEKPCNQITLPMIFEKSEP